MNPPETLRIAKHETLADPYVVAGNRAYVIGTQDGRFPDLGDHLPGEMGGVWTHPIKLLDGFWLQIDETWLTTAREFVAGPFWTEQRYAPIHGISVTRRQFAPDDERAIAVRYRFVSSSARRITVRLLARTDLLPVWSRQPTSARCAPDGAVFDQTRTVWIGHHATEPWRLVLGAAGHRPVAWQADHDLWGPERTHGVGISLVLRYDLELTPDGGETLDVVISGSTTGEEDALATYGRVEGAFDHLWHAKAVRYRDLATQSTLHTSDASLGEAWDWLKCNYDWMVTDISGVGAGFTAGVPEYPWWFGCDSAYSVLGALALGQHEVALQTLDTVRTVSERANGPGGPVVHEITTRGEVATPGSAAETPHFTGAVWQAFCWTGDVDFLRRNYDFCRRGLLEWTLGTLCPPGDLLPLGYGITEQEGIDLQCIDTAVHTLTALRALAAMAAVLGDPTTEERCRSLEARLRIQIEQDFWIESEGMYGDMVATPAEMIPRLLQRQATQEGLYYRGGTDPRVANELTALLEVAQSATEPHRKRPWLLKNWVGVSPLEAGIAPPDRARRVLDRVESDEFVGPAGMYLSGMDRTHAMSINTGVLAEAALRYGRPDAALTHLHQLTDTLRAGMPGAIAEILPAAGCFVQTWSGSAVAWPVVTQMFGIQPDAHRKQITATPCFPPGWQGAALRNVRIGPARFDFEWDGTALTMTTSDREWRYCSQ